MTIDKTVRDDPPRVAAVLDEFEIVLNKGTDNGIKAGETFLIYGIGPEISDPVTGENLGYVERVRGRGKVIHAQKTVATVRSSESRPVYAPVSPHWAMGLSSKPQPTHYEPLPFKNVEQGDLARPI